MNRLPTGAGFFVAIRVDAMTDRVVGRVGNLSETGMLLIANEPLVDDARVRAVSFTGSTAVGRRIGARAGALLKKVSLELGGKNATLVFADSDWEDQLDTIVRSTFQNSGQICLCGSRLLVERAIWHRFRDALVAHVGELVPGDPMDPDARMGPLVSQVHFDKVMAAIARARDDGRHALGLKIGEIQVAVAVDQHQAAASTMRGKTPLGAGNSVPGFRLCSDPTCAKSRASAGTANWSSIRPVASGQKGCRTSAMLRIASANT